MTKKGSFIVASLGLGGMALLVGFATVSARRSFAGRIESWQHALDRVPKAPEVAALARRLGASEAIGF
jgi:hypothetical protein